MTFFQALYGSQYYELTQKGKDGAKGRFNGNIFFAAFILVIILTVIALLVTLSSATNNSFSHAIERIFPNESGKTAGKILAIPVMAVLYLVVANTVGSVKNYNRLVEAFNQLPVEEKNKANKKILVPFFILVAILTITGIASLHI